MDLSANALTSLEQVKLHIGLEGTTQDEEIKLLINGASDFIAKYCNRNFTSDFVLPGAANAETDPPIVRNLPYDLELACIKLVGSFLNVKDSEGVKNASAGNLNITWASGLDQAVKDILSHYKTYNV
jgi:hypothetical protein